MALIPALRKSALGTLLLSVAAVAQPPGRRFHRAPDVTTLTPAPLPLAWERGEFLSHSRKRSGRAKVSARLPDYRKVRS
jgi:hypothetical protein